MARSLGKILCSGPTNVSVDNLASRIDQVSSRVIDRYNRDKQPDDTTRAHPHLVVRAYKPKDEADAFLNLLQNLHDGDNAAPNRTWRASSKWKLHLSAAFWLLVLLGAKAKGVRELRLDDSTALHELHHEINSRDDLAYLRAVATGDITWQEYSAGKVITKDNIVALLDAVVIKADMLCTTPAMTANYPVYLGWKTEKARGIVVDEAACINRADLFCVWGNTLLPCFIAGDPRQLRPTVMTLGEKDALGNLLHRLVEDSKISPLEFLQASGIPVYRLLTQLRMAEGMYDWLSDLIYSDVPFTYAASCNIDLPQFAVGRELEAYIQGKYPEETPPPAGKLWPVFVHCEGSRVYVDEITKSKRSPHQVKIALDFALHFVKTKGVDPVRLAVIAPYAANVDLINRICKRPEYSALSTMKPAATVDSFQGQEGDIVFVIMGTAYPNPGPGFTSDESRLTVLISRQKCGLVVVGDINVTGVFEGEDGGDGKGKGKGKAKAGKGKGKDKDGGKARHKFKIQGAHGEIYWTKATVLHNLYTKWHQHGRVICIPVEPRNQAEAGFSATAS